MVLYTSTKKMWVCVCGWLVENKVQFTTKREEHGDVPSATECLQPIMTGLVGLQKDRYFTVVYGL